MTLDTESIRWILSGVFLVMSGLTSWLLSRAVGQQDCEIKSHDARINENRRLIQESQLNLAMNYVSKIDLEKQLETHLTPIRENIDEMKDDVKTLLKRP